MTEVTLRESNTAAGQQHIIHEQNVRKGAAEEEQKSAMFYEDADRDASWSEHTSQRTKMGPITEENIQKFDDEN